MELKIRKSELPEMQQVVSSNIYSMGYDKEKKTMYVLFSKNATYVYRYPQIEEDRYQFVRKAESIGKTFSSSIKAYSESSPELACQKLYLLGDGVAVVEGSP